MPVENERSRRDGQLAATLFGGSTAAPAKTRPLERKEGESFTAHNARLAEVLHPPWNPRFPDPVGVVGGSMQKVKSCVRDTSGDILCQSDYGDDVHASSRLAAAHGVLRDADLSGHDFVAANASLAHTDLRNADLRGAKLLDVGHANLTGALVSEETDITGCNFAGATVGKELYEQLRQCKGFSKALNLNKPRAK
jgi:hypothetical protein